MSPDIPNFYQSAHYSSERSVGYWIKQAYNSLHRSLDARMHALDLTGMQWGPLWLIASGRADTVAACAREAGIDAGAMTRMLDRLEAKELVARERSTQDRRVVHLNLTPRGREIAAQIPPILAETMNRHLRGFSQTEFETLLALLQRFAGNAECLPDSTCGEGAKS